MVYTLNTQNKLSYNIGALCIVLNQIKGKKKKQPRKHNFQQSCEVGPRMC